MKQINKRFREPFKKVFASVTSEIDGKTVYKNFDTVEQAHDWAFQVGENDDWFVIQQWNKAKHCNVLVNEGNL